MSVEQIREELLDGGLHEESVDRLLDRYESMQSRFSQGKFDEAGTHIGNFCENMVNILRDQMGEGVEPRPSVGTFVDHCLSNNMGTNEPDSIRLQIPRMLRAAYDIRNNRDSVHVNLRVPVNRADTQAGIAICSWMLAEILRVFGDGTDDMDTIGVLITEISEPVTDRNPLDALAQNPGEFDREALLEVLDGMVRIAGTEVHPITGTVFESLPTTDQVVVLLLGRRAAADIGNIDDAGARVSWISDLIHVTDERVRQIIREFGFIQAGNSDGEYEIPGHRVSEALGRLSIT